MKVTISAAPVFIYIVSNGLGYVKIGYANDPAQRLIDLSVGSPFQLSIEACHRVKPEYARSIENVLHRRLNRYHVKGEWFRVQLDTAVKIMNAVIVEMPSAFGGRKPDVMTPTELDIEQTMSLREKSRKAGLDYDLVYRRIKKSRWTTERALTTPVAPRSPRRPASDTVS